MQPPASRHITIEAEPHHVLSLSSLLSSQSARSQSALLCRSNVSNRGSVTDMWLIDVKTRELVFAVDHRQVADRYAILSHTWEEEEVSFQQYRAQDVRERKMKGFRKINATCEQAEHDGLQYAWVDTCCINKESSAELSEAINSMWKWYRNAAICYIYLSDLTRTSEWDLSHDGDHMAVEKIAADLRGCRWLTRGWTLQELIAPKDAQFFSESWTNCGCRNNYNISCALADVTRVPWRDSTTWERPMSSFSIAERLSWAANRTTTREEDQAYCLLGLMDLNMPLLYGEGSKAFLRLQEELLRNSADQSILAWELWLLSHCDMLLAPSCYGFRNSSHMKTYYTSQSGYVVDECELSNRGLRIAVGIRQVGATTFAVLSVHEDEKEGIIPRRLRKVPGTSKVNPVSTYIIYRDLKTAPKTSSSALRPTRDPLRSAAFVSEQIMIRREGQGKTVLLEVEAGLEITNLEPKSHWLPGFRAFRYQAFEMADWKSSEVCRVKANVRDSNTGHRPTLWCHVMRGVLCPLTLNWVSSAVLLDHNMLGFHGVITDSDHPSWAQWGSRDSSWAQWGPSDSSNGVTVHVNASHMESFSVRGSILIVSIWGIKLERKREPALQRRPSLRSIVLYSQPPASSLEAAKRCMDLEDAEHATKKWLKYFE